MASFRMALDDFLKMVYLMGAAQCQKALADISLNSRQPNFWLEEALKQCPSSME